ncbi:MAG: hypothetical protein U1F68_15595 [Gammaproteobacteria bacterium]
MHGVISHHALALGSKMVMAVVALSDHQVTSAARQSALGYGPQALIARFQLIKNLKINELIE